MTHRFFPNKRVANARVSRRVNSRVFIWLAAVAVVGCIMSCGFVISARQHFESVSLGYQREDLRLKAVQLDEQLRRLELEKSRLSSSVELEKKARQAGMEKPRTAAASR